MTKEHLYIGIESSTTNCSVALIRGSKVFDSIEVNNGYTHSENLAASVETLLNKHELQVSDLSAIGIGVGPGSYTGLRIGVSFVKGLAYVNKIPVIAFTSLELLMNRIRLDVQLEKDAVVVPMIDARRMEVYCQVFDATGKVLLKPQALELDGQSFDTFFKEHEKVYCLGPGSEKWKTVQGSSKLIHLEDYYPSAIAMALSIQDKFNSKDVEDLAYFEPFYLKEFVAGKPKKVILSPE